MKPIWYWLFPACIVGLGVYVAYRNYPWWTEEDQFDKWMGWVLGAFITAVLCIPSVLAAAGLSSSVGDHADQVWRECWRGKMVSLRSADGIEGRISGGIFLMSGFVESRQTYFYYTLGPNGSFKPGSWAPDSDTFVFEENRQDGEVVQFKGAFKNAWVVWFGETDSRLKMDFHIPKGSIHQAFSLQ